MTRKTKISRSVVPIATISLFTTGLIAPSTATAEDQYFYVVNQSTKMVAEVFAHNLDDEGRVVLWPNYGGDSEQFKKQFTYNSWFLLIAKHSGKCLSRTAAAGGIAVVQKPCDPGQNAQQWKPREVPRTSADCADPNHCFGGSRTVLDNLANRYDGPKCLDADNGSAPTPPKQGVRLQIWPCIKKSSDWNVVNQDWQLVRTQDWGTSPNVH
ncbi:RICIN domain-containing protein [Streptomyces sp. NPDC059708]|uniref:RICIN domain-containing protein n=1 Tax=Streptomyces sp. NPDC059708 TaxID=3346916 RepID=UPI0036CED628